MMLDLETIKEKDVEEASAHDPRQIKTIIESSITTKGWTQEQAK